MTFGNKPSLLSDKPKRMQWEEINSVAQTARMKLLTINVTFTFIAGACDPSMFSGKAL